MNKVQTDSISVSPDEAVELMAHHLKLAALFFEAVPENDEATKMELHRILRGDDERMNPPVAVAGVLFFQDLVNIYNEMKDND